MLNLQKRINRRTYWLGLFIYYMAFIAFAAIIAIYPFNPEKDGEFEPFPDIPLVILLIGIVWFGVCIARQRANDISGKHPLIWLFLSLFLIGPIIGLIPGERKANRYGNTSKEINLV